MVNYIKWNDNALTETMDNADDTAATVDGVAGVNVTLSFTQTATTPNVQP